MLNVPVSFLGHDRCIYQRCIVRMLCAVLRAFLRSRAKFVSRLKLASIRSSKIPACVAESSLSNLRMQPMQRRPAKMT